MAIDFPQPEYGDSTRVYATVRLIGESLDPDAVTQVLGIFPCSTLTGDERPSLQPGWFLSSEGSVDSAELGRHIEYLTNQLLPVRDHFIAVCAKYEIRPSLFCFAHNPSSASIGLDADALKDLTSLRLNYEVDLYISDPTTKGYRHVREHRQRLIHRLNSSVRRPGMWGDLQASTDIRDLAFIDFTEGKLESMGTRLVERGWWSENGFRGALQGAFGNVPCIESIQQAPLVEIGLELGWIELDHQVERAEYWRLANGAASWLNDTQRTSEDVELEYGAPSLRVGGRWEASLGYGTDDSALPMIWFDADREGNIRSLRSAGDTILEEFIFGQPSSFDAAVAARNVNARRGAPNPFLWNKGS